MTGRDARLTSLSDLDGPPLAEVSPPVSTIASSNLADYATCNGGGGVHGSSFEHQ